MSNNRQRSTCEGWEKDLSDLAMNFGILGEWVTSNISKMLGIAQDRKQNCTQKLDLPSSKEAFPIKNLSFSHSRSHDYQICIKEQPKKTHSGYCSTVLLVADHGNISRTVLLVALQYYWRSAPLVHL